MKKNVKLTIWGIIILGLLVAGVYSVIAPFQVDLTKVRPGDVSLSFIEKGTVTSDARISIYPLLGGIIQNVYVKNGDKVKKGEAICVIQSDEIRSQIEQIRTSIKALEAQKRMESASKDEGVKLKEISIRQSEEELLKAKDAYERAGILYNAGAISKLEYEELEVGYKRAESALNASKQELEVLKIGSSEYYNALIAGHNINIGQLQRDIKNTVITAPVDGIITDLNAKKSNVATGSVPVAEVTASSGKIIEVFISTKDISTIEVYDEVELVLKRREGDYAFGGTISHIDEVATTQLSSLGIEESKVRIEIIPELETDIKIGVGYAVDVRFYIYRDSNKITVPKTALFTEEGKDALWVVRGGKLGKAFVEKGMELRTEFVIEEGLKEGDFVVRDANDENLKEGLRVK